MILPAWSSWVTTNATQKATRVFYRQAPYECPIGKFKMFEDPFTHDSATLDTSMFTMLQDFIIASCKGYSRVAKFGMTE
jgi:hypothetical protein